MLFDEYFIIVLFFCFKNENVVVVGNTVGKLVVLDIRKGRLV